MRHHPRPLDPTPTFEGRRLTRPHEDLEDQGLAFDVGTLLTRRRMLSLVGLGATGMALAACGTDPSGTAAADSDTAGSTASGEIPDETAGPYPGDGSNGPDVLEQSGIVRSDIRSSFGDASGTAEGVPMTLALTLSDLSKDGAAFAGVAVYVWHCTREGGYSLYSEGVTEENFLRGVQIADADGRVEFTTIFPACYTGRWPHIHFEVYENEAAITDSTSAIATSQVALPKDVCETVFAEPGYEASVSNLSQVTLGSDNVFGDDDGASQLATVKGEVASGYAATLAVAIDPTTEPTGGGGPGGGTPGDSGAPPEGGEGPPGGSKRPSTPSKTPG